MSRLKDYTSFVPLNQSIIILFSRHEENKENKDVTTIYKYGFNSLQDAVALAKVILRKRSSPKLNLWCLTQMNPLMLHLWKSILINKVYRECF